MERLDDAIERIQRFLDRLGIDEKERDFAEANAEFVDQVMKETISKGITLVRNKQGNLPINPEKKRILVDLITPQVTKQVTDKKMESAQYFVELLKERGFEVDFKWNYSCFVESSMQEEIGEYDAVMVLLDTPFAAGIFKDGFNSVWSVHLMPMSKKIILNFGSPFFIDDYYPQEETFVQVNSEMNRTSVEAVVDAILGKTEMTGKLQVKVSV